MNKNAIITIMGGQKGKDIDDSIEFMTDGIFEKKNGGYRITYNESTMTGMDGSITEILADDRFVIMKRGGPFSGSMIFESGTRHLCRYKTPAGYMDMSVSTSEIKNRMTDKGGTIKLRYLLEIGGELISENDFNIKVKEVAR